MYCSLLFVSLKLMIQKYFSLHQFTLCLQRTMPRRQNDWIKLRVRPARPRWQSGKKKLNLRHCRSISNHLKLNCTGKWASHVSFSPLYAKGLTVVWLNGNVKLTRLPELIPKFLKLERTRVLLLPLLACYPPHPASHKVYTPWWREALTRTKYLDQEHRKMTPNLLICSQAH